MKTLALSVICLSNAIAAFAASPAKIEWSHSVTFLNKKIDSPELAEFFREYGPPNQIKVSTGDVFDLNKAGVSVTSVDGYIKDVSFQIAPGKRIADHSYSGSLPAYVSQCKSPEDAIRVLGKPMKDMRDGYRKLTFLRDATLITLYYGPQLDFISFHLPEAEKGAAANR